MGGLLFIPQSLAELVLVDYPPRAKRTVRAGLRIIEKWLDIYGKSLTILRIAGVGEHRWPGERARPPVRKAIRPL